MDNKSLCLALIHADTEEDVIALLREAGYWDDSDCWRYYGDIENNFSIVGNQQSRPDSALMEKIVNSVDALLMNECLVRGIDPESGKAPTSVRDAVAIFFENVSKPSPVHNGRVSNWPDSKRREVSQRLTLACTGHSPQKGNPCFTITDEGEGQTLKMIPLTLLSLNRSNKLRIPFVQGKFNMGGTGVLQFCGRHNLQLVVTKRNPKILIDRNPADKTADEWGFTVVGREDPLGARRNSVYTYLAPVGANSQPGKGEVLSFHKKSLAIMPSLNDPYSREVEHGTLIKLYEYEATGFKSHILMRDGLLGRANLLLPDIALPVRFHECRKNYRGHKGSFDTTVTGLGVRLEDDKAENLEEGFPYSSAFKVAGEGMTATIYAFKKGTADTYRRSEAIVFTVNGQTQAILKSDFLRRPKVGMSYIADTVLLVIDCSKCQRRALEDLFMNSRDRLRSGDLREKIENELQEMIKNHPGLRSLREKRRREDLEAKLDDSKPLADMLESIINRFPSVKALFLPGSRISTPFKTELVAGEDKPFKGLKHPSYFKVKDLEYGEVLERECHSSKRSRITFETNADNDYFDRADNPGTFSLQNTTDNRSSDVDTYVLNLLDGIATLSLTLPDTCKAGDELSYRATVSDPTMIQPFVNDIRLRVVDSPTGNGGNGKRRKAPSRKRGRDREQQSGLQLPNIVDVHESEWGNDFDKYSALRIKNTGAIDENESTENGKDSAYDFFVNIDNIHLQSELKSGYEEAEVVRARFRYGIVMVGLAMIQDFARGRSGDDAPDTDEEASIDIEEQVFQVTKAISPVILPIIESLGGLSSSDL
jgi:hypothetical protein